MNYQEYAVNIRRQLHRVPEVGYDLTKTLAIVRRELDAMGIPYTEEFGQSSIVATINEEKKHFTIGVRADMDALPLQEETGLDFASTHPGKMHACGHDLHTAMLLSLAKKLKDNEKDIRCRVKLLFTPAEEFAPPGCRMMAKNGVMDDIDCVIATHVDPSMDTGCIAADDGGQGANALAVTVKFTGKTAHVLAQQRGVDAIAMAVEAYQALQVMISKEFPPYAPRLLNVGVIHGGAAINIIAEECSISLTARAQEDALTEYTWKRINEICQGIAQTHGGKAEIIKDKLLPCVINDPIVTEAVRAAAQKVVGEDKILPKQRTMGAEDFSFLCRQKPGAQFWVGSRNENPDTARPLHNAGIVFDEGCLAVGRGIFWQFIVDNQDGMQLQPVTATMEI